jgi:hypothetical protein
MGKEKEKRMQETIPLPGGDYPEKSVQAEIDAELYDAIKAEAKKRKATVKEVVTWGFKKYLEHTNPKLADKLRSR